VLPNKRPNTEFLDYTNTWMITTNIDSRPPVETLPLPTAHSVGAVPGQRPAYLRVPGELPQRCQLANEARIRDAVNAAASTNPSSSANPSSGATPNFEDQAMQWLAGAGPPSPPSPTPAPAPSAMAAPSAPRADGLMLGLVALVLLVVLLIAAQPRQRRVLVV